ncbi:MAG: hypothetical protein NZ739_05800 [Verrucomicrobiae bacterium]|nr:hypothetical protein [Verrucomicrobiae bacterium]MDW7978947.1 hypothetical protein [Verrucomicrobiales bacterium]
MRPAKQHAVLVAVASAVLCAEAQTHTIIKHFGILTNMTGLNPRGELVQGPDGTLYGTAGPEGAMGGTLFKLRTDGSGFTVLKWFTNRLEGAEPNGGLALANGVLYGTTYSGGASNLEMLFKLNTDGSGFCVLKHFTGTDGANPNTELALCGGELYGTTSRGGIWDLGTVFRLNLTDPAGPCRLTAQLIDGAVVLSWSNPAFLLQSAPDPSGPFTNVPGATSPYTNPPTLSRQFYRLVAN